MTNYRIHLNRRSYKLFFYHIHILKFTKVQCFNLFYLFRSLSTCDKYRFLCGNSEYKISMFLVFFSRLTNCDWCITNYFWLRVRNGLFQTVEAILIEKSILTGFLQLNFTKISLGFIFHVNCYSLAFFNFMILHVNRHFC